MAVQLSRSGNLLGALSLAVADRLAAATETAAGAGASAPAALATLSTYHDRQLSVEQLRMIIGLSHSATVRLVDRLGAARLVERRAGRDGREVVIALTARGRTAARRIADERAKALNDVVQVLDSDAQRILGDLLATLIEPLVAGRAEARFICRLCAHDACAHEGGCPVDQAASALGE